MATLIKSANQLQKMLETKAQQAIMLSQAEIYEVVQKHMEGYYNEAVFNPPDKTEPDVYQRTYQFLNNLIQTNITTKNGAISCSVQFDEDYFNYTYKGGATGFQVLEWANEQTHGGTVPGKIEFWNDAMEELGGRAGIMKIIEKNFKKVGLPLTK